MGGAADSPAGGEFPVQHAGAGVDRAGLQVAGFDLVERQHLAVIAGREQLVGLDQVLGRQGALVDLDAGFPQQLDHPLPGDAIEEGAVRHRRVGGAVLGDPQIGGRELGDVAHGVEHDRLVEAARLRVGAGASGLGIETHRLGVGRRALGRGPAPLADRGAGALGLGQRRLDHRDADPRRRRVRRHPAVLRPQERPQIERGVLGEHGDAVLQELADLSGRHRRFQAERLGRADGARTVEVEIGGHALERAGAVEHRGPHPNRVAPRRHQQRVALDPLAVEEMAAVDVRRGMGVLARHERMSPFGRCRADAGAGKWRGSTAGRCLFGVSQGG